MTVAAAADGGRHSDTRTRVLNFMGFQLGWFSCVVGAGAGHVWLGPFVVAGLTGAALATSRIPGRVRLLWLGLLLGVILDSGFGAAGLLSFSANPGPEWLSPPWMAALWVNFGLTLHQSLAWLRGRYILSGLLGAVGGPASYWAGRQLGAIELSHPASLTILALVWGLAVPLMVYWSRPSQPSCGDLR